LAAQGAAIRFVVNDDVTVLGILRHHGIEAVGVPSGEIENLRRTARLASEWGGRALIVDSYDVTGACLATLDGVTVIVIDDLADRDLPVDLVINGGADASDLVYRVAADTRLLLGPRYSLLREEFGLGATREIRQAPQRVLITVGGEDEFALTPRLVAWTRQVLGMAVIDVVIGPFFTAETTVEMARMAREDRRIAVHEAPEGMRDLMLGCDIAVTGGGQTAYELAATGTPAVAITIADNQVGGVRALAAAGVLACAGNSGDPDLAERMQTVLRELAARSLERRAMSEAARRLVDGRGTARAAQAILEMCRR